MKYIIRWWLAFTMLSSQNISYLKFKEKYHPDFYRYSTTGFFFTGGLTWSIPLPGEKTLTSYRAYNYYSEVRNTGVMRLRGVLGGGFFKFWVKPLSMGRVALWYHAFAGRENRTLVEVATDRNYSQEKEAINRFATHALGAELSYCLLLKRWWHGLFINVSYGFQYGNIIEPVMLPSDIIHPSGIFVSAFYGIGYHIMPEPQWIFIPWLDICLLTVSPGAIGPAGIKYGGRHFFLFRLRLEFLKLRERGEKCPPVYVSPQPKEPLKKENDGGQ